MLTSPNRVVALILGAAALAFGVLGFTATTGVGLFSTPGGLLVGLFEVNPAQNIAKPSPRQAVRQLRAA